MIYLDLIYNFLIQFLILFFLVFYSFKFSKKNKLSLIIILIVIFIHIGFTYLNSYQSYGTNTDAPRYFRFASEANSWFSLFGLSTTFIKFLIYPFIHFFKFNYTSLFVLFGSLSIYGYLLLYKILKSFKYSYKLNLFGFNLITLILLLPSFHFWTSLVGKDSLVFVFSMITLNRFLFLEKTKTNIIILFFYILLLTFVRPYIGVFIFVSAISVYVLNNLTVKKMLIGILITTIGSYISILIFKKLNIDVFSFLNDRIEWLSTYIERKDEGSFVDPTKLSILEKMFAYMYRPLFFDAKGISQILISLENGILFLMTLKLLLVFRWRNFKSSFAVKIFIIYCLVFVLIKSYLLYNFGISNRQKYMILPLLFYVLYYFNDEYWREKSLKIKV